MKKRILVIDDERAVRDSFELALFDDNFEVRVAENGFKGVELAREARPDLIFLDLKMPEIDGIETMKRLLANDPTLHIYIVTAFAREFIEPLQRVREQGAMFQLAAKPLTAGQIRAIARSILDSTPEWNLPRRY